MTHLEEAERCGEEARKMWEEKNPGLPPYQALEALIRGFEALVKSVKGEKKEEGEI